MKSTYETMGGSYHQESDYLLPDLEVPENPQIGIWGGRRRRYLQTNKRVLYTVMLLCDTLWVLTVPLKAGKVLWPHRSACPLTRRRMLSLLTIVC